MEVDGTAVKKLRAQQPWTDAQGPRGDALAICNLQRFGKHVHGNELIGKNCAAPPVSVEFLTMKHTTCHMHESEGLGVLFPL